MNLNPAAALSLITSLYEQLSAAHAEIERLNAKPFVPDPENNNFVPCDPADGPRVPVT